MDVDIELKSSVGNHGNTEWFIDLNGLRAPNGSRPLPGEQLMPTGDEIKCEFNAQIISLVCFNKLNLYISSRFRIRPFNSI